MKQLMQKEWKLAVQPATIVFELLCAMLLIPAYPYLIAFFYATLGIFFVCLFGRENRDVLYTALLPVSRRQIVTARVRLCVELELIFTGGAALFALARSSLGFGENPSGLTPNAAFFGIALGALGLFNLVFLSLYYRNTAKVGIPFLIASIVYGCVVGICDMGSAGGVPVFRRVNSLGPEDLGLRVAVLIVGIALYALCTFAAYRISLTRFQKEDIA